MYLNEIGLELELFLLDRDNNILEPSLYGFPADEMGFLIELRSIHSDIKDEILRSLSLEREIVTRKASSLGFKVVQIPNMEVTLEFIQYISNKYRHPFLPDYTKNIYGNIGHSHHTGFIDNRATAGLHVHFSSREIVGNKCYLVKLPAHRIVKEMDDHFQSIIYKNKRILGEYENKSHGFEYRSLPNNAPIDRVLDVSFEILNRIVDML